MNSGGSLINISRHGMITIYDEIIKLSINGSFLDFSIIFTQLKKKQKIL